MATNKVILKPCCHGILRVRCQRATAYNKIDPNGNEATNGKDEADNPDEDAKASVSTTETTHETTPYEDYVAKREKQIDGGQVTPDKLPGGYMRNNRGTRARPAPHLSFHIANGDDDIYDETAGVATVVGGVASVVAVVATAPAVVTRAAVVAGVAGVVGFVAQVADWMN